jgi:hypothetical protein
MARRRRPEVVSTRVFERDRALIRALAEAEGLSVSEAVYRLLLPAVRQRLAEVAGAGGPGEMAGT